MAHDYHFIMELTRHMYTRKIFIVLYSVGHFKSDTMVMQIIVWVYGSGTGFEIKVFSSVV